MGGVMPRKMQAVKFIVVALSTLLLATACAPSPPPVEAPGNLTQEQAQALYGGRLTVLEYRAISAAMPSLARWGHKVEDYKLISLRSYDQDRIRVSFSQRALGYDRDLSTGRYAYRLGNSSYPGEAPDFQVLMSARDFSVLSLGYSQ